MQWKSIVLTFAVSASLVSQPVFAGFSGSDFPQMTIQSPVASRYVTIKKTSIKVADIEGAQYPDSALALTESTVQKEILLAEDTVLTVTDNAEDENGSSYLQVLINNEMIVWVAESDLAEVEVLLPTNSANIEMISPVIGRITSRPGMRKHPILKVRKVHAGTDIAAPSGTPVKAAAKGKVAFAGWAGGYGKVVYLNHGEGIQTRYAHMSAITVRTGQMVAQGSQIGNVGTTGRSTGPHLHFEKRGN